MVIAREPEPLGLSIIGGAVGAPGSTGTVTVDGAGSSWTIAGTLNVGNGSLSLSNGGAVNVENGGGVVTLGNSDAASGFLNLGGTAAGPAAAGGILNAATITTVSGTGTVQFNTTGNASPPYNFTRDGTSTGGAIAITGSTQVVNTAGFNVLTGANDYSGATVINGGTLEIGSGGLLQNNSTITNHSNFIVSSGATVDGSGSYTQDAGVALIQSGGALDAAFVNLLGGMIQVDGTLDVPSIDIFATLDGTGSIIGDLTNDGTLLLADLMTDPGTLSETGDYMQNSDGTFLESISSRAHGMFDVTGNIDLGGELDISILNGFDPANHQIFNLIQFSGTETGQFSGIEGSDAADWTVLYGAKDSDLIQLEYIGPNTTPPRVPEPSVWLDQAFLLSLALAYPLLRRRLAHLRNATALQYSIATRSARSLVSNSRAPPST